MIKSFFIKSFVIVTFLMASLNSFSTNYYVNDGSQIGDIYTDTIGDNGNPGTAAAPFATLTHVVNTVGLVSGDTVFIDAGSYIQTDANLALNVNNTYFVGAGYSLTIFDNQAASADANRWATITGDNISVIGMKITKYNYGTSDGTAIFVNGATGLLIQNVLTDENKPGGGGSSIYITNSASVSLIGGGANCNTAVSLTGGGVKIYGAGNVVSFDNYSFSNNSKDYEQGSGLHIDGTPTTIVTVRNSIFADNRNLVGSAGGAAIYLAGSNLSVYGSCFKDNVSGSVTTVYGGAISVGRGATLNVSNCSFTNNTAGGTGKGGAISINTSFDDFGSGSAALVNVDSCSFSGNSSGEAADLYARVGSGNSSTFNVNECTFSGTVLDIRDDNTAAINIQNSGNPTATGAGINKINTNPASVFPITSCPLLVGSCYAAPCINPTPTGSAAQSFCLTNNPTVANLSAIGGTILWYSSATLGTALATNTPLVNGQTYYASDETVGCDPSDPRFAVTVTLVSGPPSAGGNGTLTICSGTTVTAAQLFASLTGSPAVGGVWTPALAGAGTYTYTQAATSPCTTDSTATVTVSEQALPPSAGGNGTLTICAGTTVTAAQLFASLTGSPAVGGVWTPALAGAGTYTYTQAATSPCTTDNTATVSVSEQSLPPSAGENGILTICAGTTVTAAQLFASLTGSPVLGGVWTPALAGAGIYTYTQAATSPCTTDSTATVTVSEQALPPSAGGDGTLTICAGTTVTAAQLFASLTGSPEVGGVWTPVLAGAGTYTYTHAATSPCTIDSTAIVTVSEFPIVFADAGSNSYTICTGDSVQLGIVAVPGVIYSWSPIINLSNPNISNPFAFPNDTTTYYLTASQNGCVATDSVVINSNELPDLDASLIFIQNSNCGNNNGSITGLSASGYPILTYSWTNGSTQVSTDIDLLNQISGSYSLTVTDGNLCSKSFGPFNISDIGAPSIDITNIVITPDTCGKSIGSIVGIAVSGGIAPLTFEWVLGSDTIGNTLDLNNLVAGNYVLYVTDSAGCNTVSGPFSVTEISGPTLIETFASVLDDHCGQSIGSITGITSNGGTGVLTYSWNNGTIEVGTALDLTSLPSGNYNLTVTDDAGCQATGSSYLINNIAGPSLDTVLMLVGDAACGGADGQITNVTATGGVLPYTWSWFDGVTLVGSSQDLTGVIAGNYSVVVTDSFGCIDSLGTIMISNSAAAAIDVSSISVSDASCNASNGSITGITVTGGTLPYTYSWSNGAVEVSTNLDLTGMPLGSYTLTVTDSNGCQSSAGPFNINQANSLTIDVSSISVTDASCNGSNGSITGITVTGGTLPYIYSWSNGTIEVSTSLDLTNMPLGTYTLTVTDSNGCQSQTAPININGGNPPTINTTISSVVNANCNTINGSISNISISGGVQPYSYQWTNNGTVVGTNLDISLIDMGWYILTVTDSLGCSSTDSVFVDRDLVNNILANDDYVTTQQNVGVQISPLINDLGASSLTILNGPINGTASGSVFYTPNTGYFGVDSILYEICDVVCTTICDTATIYIEIEKERRIRIYDGFSPNGDGSNETFYIENIEFFPENELLIYSRWGDLVYSAKPYNNEWDGSSKTNGVKLIGNKVVDGTYFFILKLTPESEANNGTIDLRR